MEDTHSLEGDEPIYTPPENPVREGSTLSPSHREMAAANANQSDAAGGEPAYAINTSGTQSNDAPTTTGGGPSEKPTRRSSLLPHQVPNPMERISTQSKFLPRPGSDASSSEDYRMNPTDPLTGKSSGRPPVDDRVGAKKLATDDNLTPKVATSTSQMRKPLTQTAQRSVTDYDIFRPNDFSAAREGNNNKGTGGLAGGGNVMDDERSGGGDDDDEDVVSVDSYGIPRYNARYPSNTGRIGRPARFGDTADDLSVPWYLRKPGGHPYQCTFFDFLRQPQFWRLFEFATRITAIAVLVPSAIIAARLPMSPFVSPYAVISATILASKGNVGEAVAYLFVWIRAGCLWLPLAVIAGAIGLGHHIAGWCVYYTAILFIMAVLTEAMPRRIVLLLFNSCLVGLLTDPTRGAVYSCRVMGDWCIGTGLCLVAAFFPYPIFCKKEAQRLLSEIAKNTATAFRGLVYSFWSPTNVERNMAMSKVRIMTESLDSLLPAFEHSQAFSFYEFLFESAEVRELRQLKFHVFERLRVNLSSMTRVLDMVEANPSAIDNSDRSQAFGELLMPHLNSVAEAFDELMDLLAAAKTKKAILNLSDHMDNLRHQTEELQEAYVLARRMLFYEHTSDTLEEFVPLMTFYLFTVVCFRDTMDICEVKVKAFKAGAQITFRDIFKRTAWNPFMENVNFVRTLFNRWNRREVQRVIEAAKVSAAMILTIGFSYLIKIDEASFSGPNIIAFVSGMNPVEALQASIVRLTGCLIGTVLGFFAGTYSDTAVQRVASLCTLMFVGTFLRTDKEYGIMSVYAMFVLVPLDSVLETTIEDTVARMNQNTFGIFIYLFVSILILPLSPSFILRAKRGNVLKRFSSCLSNMMWLFTIPLASEFGNRSFSFKNMKDISENAAQVINERSHRGQFGGGDDQADLDSDDLEMPTSREALPAKVSNRSIHMVLRTDTPMEELNKQLDDIIKRLKGTKEFMGFAKDERGLVTVDYPVKACQATYLHMHRMAFLLKTMWLSWNVMRSQRRYTPDTVRMLRNLQPIARDVASAYERITELITYMMKDPSVNLEGELMKAELDLMSACAELHTRKSQIMLMLINGSVEEYRKDLGALGDHDSSVSPTSVSPGVSGNAVAGDEEEAFPEVPVPQQQQQQQSQELRRSHTNDFYRRPHSSLAQSARRADGQAMEVTFSDRLVSHYDDPRRFSPSGPNAPGRLPRSSTFDGAVYDFPGSTPVASPTTQRAPYHGNFRVVASEKNVSVMPYLHRSAGSPTDASEGPVRLPSDFQFPVTSEDAEGLHSLTLCLEMFADETKLLMMSLSVMLDHLRSKL